MYHTELKRYREELKISQEQFAKEADLKYVTYRSVENGKNTSYTTATTILTTLNRLRSEKELNEVKLEDLKLKIV